VPRDKLIVGEMGLLDRFRIYFDYAPVADACVVSAWAKVDGEWQLFSRKAEPGERPFLLIPASHGLGTVDVFAPTVERGSTMQVRLP